MTRATRSSSRRKTGPGGASASAAATKKKASPRSSMASRSKAQPSTGKTTEPRPSRRAPGTSKASSRSRVSAGAATKKERPPKAASASEKNSASTTATKTTSRPRRLSSVSFPPARRFLVGTALSVYQNSGGPDTNWSEFEKRRAWGGIRPSILGNTRCGLSSGFWDGKYDADAELAASVGSNCMRLSIEWSRVVPRPGVVDRSAIQRYRDIFDSLERRGMEPLVTLHHFVHPSWFDSEGAFESDEGLRHFVEWSRVAFEAFGGRVASWCTFNEPGVFASSGYCTGFFPPGKVFHLRTAGEVLLRMLRSHTASVRVMRRMSAEMRSKARGGDDEIPKHSFGIVHNVMPYEAKPYFLPVGSRDLAEDTASIEQGFHSGITIEAERTAAQEEEKRNRMRRRDDGGGGRVAPTPVDPPPSRDRSRGWSPPWSRAAAALGHAQWGNDVVLRYLRTGVFDWDPLGGCLPPALERAARRVLGERRVARLPRVAEPERPPLDWFGLNFYGRVVLDWKLSPTCYPGELMSDFGQGVWPAGFKAAMRRASRELRVPIVVTETGVPDGEDAIRGEWADAYLGAAEELLREEGLEEEREGESERKKRADDSSLSSPPSSSRRDHPPVDLRGVCYWSLVDSFEWAFGYSWFTKFGLFGWDYKSGPDGERTRRASASAVAGWFRRLPAAAEARWRRAGLGYEAAFPPVAARAIGGGGGGRTAATATARETKRTTAVAAAATSTARKRSRPSPAAPASLAASRQHRRR